MTQEWKKVVHSTKGLSVIESGGAMYICLPHDYCVQAGVHKATPMQFQYAAGIICYMPIRAPVDDETSEPSTLPTNITNEYITKEKKLWEQIAELPPNIVQTIFRKIDELANDISALNDRLDRVVVTFALEKKAAERQPDKRG